ncbi:hypothetical protein PR003_g20396 [Phytophthora rubi]|uniref:START domain-containing protein n=1 Tax=Phytophthora rubi TaxID=129364 RepID=A0A6A3JTS6_9STRA|nr:hypothetical protein PR002_g19810 [Phytophthora rubi]KAE8998261.1 hypothetical protein PR001_g19379 [Phytophthora rubi]KAE9309914.1 hypothetical protein PR003_g20396 [Phytophthora rubi]
MASLQDARDHDPLETLPPLSPTMQRALLEMFGDDQVSEESQEVETVSVRQQDARQVVQWVSPASAAVSPTLDAMTADWQEELTTMSPSETKGGLDDSPEAKRARRSAIEKKSRQRRQSVLRRMRQEMKQLEEVYEAVATRQQATAGDGVMRSRRKYSQLSLATQALEEDRRKLLKLLESHEVFQRTADAMAIRSVGAGRIAAESQDDELIWDTGVPPSSSFAARVRLRTSAECYALVRETYETMKHFEESGHFVSTGAQFMGWTDKRTIDANQALQYKFTKTFPHESAEKLLLQTWDVFTHADSMAHLSFSASVTTRWQVVQTLSDDLYIARRDHKVPNSPMTFVMVNMIFRLQTPTGYTLCMRTIPAPEITEALEPHEFYYDVFHWTHFNDAFDEDGRPAGCEISTGGHIADAKQLIVSKYWLFELVISVLRWEHMCVAPLFLKSL